jgi:hypothetical protein
MTVVVSKPAGVPAEVTVAVPTEWPCWEIMKLAD